MILFHTKFQLSHYGCRTWRFDVSKCLFWAKLYFFLTKCRYRNISWKLKEWDESLLAIQLAKLNQSILDIDIEPVRIRNAYESFSIWALHAIKAYFLNLDRSAGLRRRRTSAKRGTILLVVVLVVLFSFSSSSSQEIGGFARSHCIAFCSRLLIIFAEQNGILIDVEIILSNATHQINSIDFIFFYIEDGKFSANFIYMDISAMIDNLKNILIGDVVIVIIIVLRVLILAIVTFSNNIFVQIEKTIILIIMNNN